MGGVSTKVQVKDGVATLVIDQAVSGTHVRERTFAIRVVGANSTVPSGKVKLVLRKVGNKSFHKVRRRSLTKGSRTFTLGKLGKGKYKVVTKYRGDANHLRSRTVKRFRVRRR